MILVSIGHYHTLCQRYIGRAVELRTRDGRIHRGIIQRVDNRRVYIRPLGNPRGLGGFGIDYYGGYSGRGFVFGIALGALIGLALIPFFFW